MSIIRIQDLTFSYVDINIFENVGESINYQGKLNIGPKLKISYVNQDTSYLNESLIDFILNNSINQTLFKTIKPL